MTRILIIFIFFLFSSIQQHGQTVKLVEEVAFYHLDSLTKVDSSLIGANYMCNGFIEREMFVDEDSVNLVFFFNYENYTLNTRFRQLVLDKDSKRTTFNVPKDKRFKGKKYPTTIFKHLYRHGKYYVHFRVDTDNQGGYYVLIVMDPNGNLIGRKVTGFIF